MNVTPHMKRIAQDWYNKEFSQLTTEQKFNVFDESEWIDKNYDDEQNRNWHKLSWGSEPTRGIDPRKK